MGRPSKLSDKQWGEIGRRLARGDSMRALAKEYRVGVARISERFSERVPELKELAGAIATTERAFEQLPVSEQVAVRTLADQMKQASNSLAEAAVNGAAINARLTGLAVKRLDTITEDSSPDDLKPIAAMVATGNEASKTALALVNANKGAATTERTLEDLLEEANQKRRG